MQLHRIPTCQAVGSLGSGVCWLWREPAALNPCLPRLLQVFGTLQAVPVNL